MKEMKMKMEELRNEIEARREEIRLMEAELEVLEQMEAECEEDIIIDLGAIDSGEKLAMLLGYETKRDLIEDMEMNKRDVEKDDKWAKVMREQMKDSPCAITDKVIDLVPELLILGDKYVEVFNYTLLDTLPKEILEDVLDVDFSC